MANSLKPDSYKNASPAKLAIRRFCQNRAALISFFLLVIIILACLLTLNTSAVEYSSQNLDFNRRPPQINHEEFAPFGYDVLGRSLLWRCLFGGVLSLGIGFSAALISVVIGTAWGMTAGWYGGKVDNILMRIVDVLYGLPYVLLIILFKIAFEDKLVDMLNLAAHMMANANNPEAFLSRFAGVITRHAEHIANVSILFAAIGGISWLTMARVIRGQVLSLKSLPFIEASRAIGLPTWKIFMKHLIPNLAGPIIVYATLTVPQAILQESFLSFIGLGIQAPMPTWGSLAGESVKAINTVESFWWMVVFPSGFLAITLLCLNFIGDGMRDALDPRTKR